MSLPWEDEAPPLTRRAHALAVVRRQPSAVLLLVQIAVIVLLPFLEDFRPGRLVLSSLTALVAAVFAVRSTRALRWVSLTLALPAAVLEVWGVVSQRAEPLAIGHLALAAFYAFTAYALIAYVVEDFWVTEDELFAVGACFTVIVFAFAYVYLAMQEVWMPSFTSFDGSGRRTLLELLQFSAANFTSVGLSDIAPVRPEARAVVTVQQLAGVLYVAMVVSRLVALTVFRGQR